MKINLDLIKDKPKFITQDSVNMLTVMGSRAYGTETPTSDWDFYGFIVPPIQVVFPHVKGDIPGFGRNIQTFDQYQGQHVKSSEGQEFDVTIYNIVKYFQLCMEGNPNMIDSLFTDNDSLMWVDNVGQMVRSGSKLFLSQKCFHTFRGMAHSHMSRLENRTRVGSRLDVINEHGYDTKDASHVLRCMFELKQILITGDLDLKQHSRMIKQIKDGQWTKEEVVQRFEVEMDILNTIMDTGLCVVPHSPPEYKIKQLLVDCLEEAYGSLNHIGFNTF